MFRRRFSLIVLCVTLLVAGCTEDDDIDIPENSTANSSANGESDAGTDTDDSTTDTGSDADGGGEPDAVAPGDPPVPGEDPGWIGGRSLQQRPIAVEHYGQEGPVLFVLSAIHGNERLGVTYAERFRTALNAGFAETHGIQVVFMQATNPDGIARYERYNVNAIDLNRNFPTDNFEPGGPGGDEALSEPETEAIRDAVDASGLSAVLTLHCCAPGFDHDGPAELLAEAMSEAMDPAHRFEVIKLGASPGSLGSYVGLDMGRPIITAEFAVAEDIDPFVQLAQMGFAVEAAAGWTVNNPVDDTIDFGEMTTEDDWSYRSTFAGGSAGGRPLRVESIGTADGERFVLLSGFDGELRLGAWTAEHIRRELLGIPELDAEFWRIITAANPDGLADWSTENDDGVDIEAAVASGDDSTQEAAAVLEVLDGEPATVFLVDNSRDGTDRVYVTGPRSAELAEDVPPQFSTDSAPENTDLADSLGEDGHTVVHIAVATETLEAQDQSRELAPGYDSPFDYSDMVFQMVGR